MLLAYIQCKPLFFLPVTTVSSVHDNTMVWAQIAVHYSVPNSFKGMTPLGKEFYSSTVSGNLYPKITEE